MVAQSTLDDERQQVSELGASMLADGLTKGTGGNISIQNGDRIAISPSGMPYDEITPDDVPVIDLDGEKVAGDTDPSSEFRMHSDIIRERDDVGAVVHTHSPYASTFASLNQPIEASHYLIAFAGHEIPVASYETYGTAEIAESALEALGDEYKACLLENHGVIAVGADAETAYYVAQMVEYCAQVHYQILNIGEPHILPESDIQDMIDHFYGGYHKSEDEIEEAEAIAPPPTELEDERQEIAELGRRMLRDDLTTGTGGNISAQRGDKVAISPSGIDYEKVDAEDIPLVTLDEEQIAGEYEASSEMPMHNHILRERDDVGGVVHTHSPYASTFASMQEPIEASHYLIAFAGDEIPCTGYETPTSVELAEAALDALGDEYNACLLGNHGVIAVGETVGEAYEVALMVEYCARIHYQALGVGEPSILPEEEIDNLLSRFANYGQSH